MTLAIERFLPEDHDRQFYLPNPLERVSPSQERWALPAMTFCIAVCMVHEALNVNHDHRPRRATRSQATDIALQPHPLLRPSTFVATEFRAMALVRQCTEETQHLRRMARHDLDLVDGGVRGYHQSYLGNFQWPYVTWGGMTRIGFLGR